jgi:hypothetical protein
MGYQRRKGPIDYKGYGRKKKPGRATRLSKAAILLILGVVGLGWWLLSADPGQEKESQAVSGGVAFQERRNIYDRSLTPLAVSFDLYAAYIKPLEVDDPQQTGEILAAGLGLDRDQLIKSLRTERSYVWLGHQVPRDKVDELTKLRIPGLFFQKSPVRFYPHMKTAAQVVGYVKDEQGLAGIELFYDKELQGGALSAPTGGAGRQTFAAGKDVVLTLDLKIQTILEKQMALLLDKTQAGSVAAMAVDPATGEIIAAVQLPSFDPNSFWDATPQSQKMDMISRVMHLGGISGLFRYAAAVHADRDIRMVDRQENAAIVLAPRLEKSTGRARAGYWWPWSGGGFISNELTELPDPTIAAEELLAFQQDLGVGCADAVDLPVASAGQNDEACGEGRLNGISILGALSRLVNGGTPVALHFLKGTVEPSGSFSPQVFKAPGREMAKVSAVLGKSFAASAGDRAPFFAAEYLAPLARQDDFVVEGQEGQESAAVLPAAPTYDGLLVAASPADRARLVLLVAVQEGEFDLKAASPMRRAADSFLRLAAKEMRATAPPASRQGELAEKDELYAQWRQSQATAMAGQEVRATQVGIMPAVVGLSLRKALLALMPCRVMVEMEGAGMVVAQEPEAGKECRDRVRLVLTSDLGAQAQ